MYPWIPHGSLWICRASFGNQWSRRTQWRSRKKQANSMSGRQHMWSLQLIATIWDSKTESYKASKTCCSKWVCWRDLINKHGTIYAVSYTVFWWMTKVMCAPKVHVSYCKVTGIRDTDWWTHRSTSKQMTFGTISVAIRPLRTVSIGPAWSLDLSSCDFYPQGAQQKQFLL